MELREFFKLLGKHRNLLIIVPLVTIIISVFLVRNLEDEYISTAQISTGIIDQTRQLLDPDITNYQETKISGQFNNLIEVMKLKKMFDMVSYQLMIHDLTSNTPFRKLAKPYNTITPAEKQKAVALFKDKLSRLEPLSLYNSYEKYLNEMLLAMHYDERSLRKDIIIYHEDYSDFITVKCSSENQFLSAFAVNSLCQGFIDYQTLRTRQNEIEAVNYLSSSLADKKHKLDSATQALQQYKIANDVLDLEDQSKTTLDQMSVNNEKLMQAQKDMASYSGALRNVDKKFEPGQRQYLEQSLIKANTAIAVTQDQLHATSDRYVRSGFDPRVSRTIDSLKKVLSIQLAQSEDKAVTDPMQTKQDLLRQRMELETNYNLARYSVDAILDEQQRLNRNLKRLTPLDATVKNLQFQIDINSKEYQDVLARYNAANLQYRTDNKLLQIEKATPDVAQPSKRMLLVILSGVISFVFCVVVLFGMFYLDNAIKDPVSLANSTGLPVLGYLNLISGPAIDLRKIWDVEHRDKMQQFKDLLRAIRFEIDQELRGEKIVAITSMRQGEGKTLLAISLAYSYSMINKKVLLIDGNFDNPTISNTVNPRLYLEDFFKNDPLGSEPISSNNSVLGNRGGDITLLEISSELFIRNKFAELKQAYDVILIETPPLDAMNKAKEWLLFANRTVAVFESGQDIANGKKQLVSYLQKMENKFAGWILNKSNYGIRKSTKR